MNSKIIVSVMILALCLACNQSNKAETPNDSQTVEASTEINTNSDSDQNEDLQSSAERVSIKDIVENPTVYEGKSVIVSGKCTKVNMAIMGRNWIHLVDGTKDDFDFVVTSNAEVTKGETVSMRGVVTIDKDFGHGYRYAVIMEEAEVLE